MFATSKLSQARVCNHALGIVLLAFSLLALVVAPPANARKTHLFLGTFGSAAQPNFSSPNSLAVDQSTGDLLVIAAAGTVSRWNPDGTPHDFSALGTNVIDAKKGAGNKACAEEPSSCDRTPQNGFSFGTFAGEQQIAVDESGTVTDGNIYVTQGKQAAGNLIDIFASSGEYLGQLTAAGGIGFGTSGSFPFSPCGVAVDGAGNLFVGGGYDEKIYKFAPSANPPVNSDYVMPFAGSRALCNVAAGSGSSSGFLFTSEPYGGSSGASISKFDAVSGSLESVITTTAGEDYLPLVTVDKSTGHLYVANTPRLGPATVREYAASGLLASTFSASGVSGIAVDAASGKVYISGGGVSGPVGVYGPTVTVPDVTTGAATITGTTTAALNGTVNPDEIALEECRFEYGLSTAYGQTVPCAETPAEIGLGPKAVHADLSGLAGETLYHYRLVAKNSNATINGSDQTFKTPSKPAITAEWAADVGFSEATLNAKINPENAETTYRFEWGADTSYGQSTAEIGIGSGTTERTVRLIVDELEPGTTYHYRVVATNSIGVTEGADRSLNTYTHFTPDTNCTNQVFRIGSAALLPDCRAYEMVSPVDKNNADIVPLLTSSELPGSSNQSAIDGEKLTYSAFKAFGDAVASPYNSQYLTERDANAGWVGHSISPPRAGGTLTPSALFLPQQGFTPDLCSGWFIQDTALLLAPEAVAGYPNLYRADLCGGGGYEAITRVAPPERQPDHYFFEVQGSSADGSHTVFRANDKLTPNAPGGDEEPKVYDYFNGKTRLVCVLPSKVAVSGCSAGTANGRIPSSNVGFGSVQNAVSEDGSRIFWTADGGLPGKLYVRINAVETIAVSKGTAQFWGASSDGARAIISEEGGQLFEFELEADEPEAGSAIAGGLVGVVGMSEDASRVYFVSTEDLDGGAAAAGEPNLYLHGEGGFTFIATLADNDIEAFLSPTSSRPAQHAARVTPDGGTVAFVSKNELTGQDSTDVNSGEPDSQVYLWDAGDEVLRCVSCNRSGSRPIGRDFNDYSLFVKSPFWAAALLPTTERQLYAPRPLSEDGRRLFFESFDALVPGDANGALDVYQWETNGKGGCEEAEGCISLISSGESPQNSEFVDADTDGSDVFFTTNAALLPQDPGLIDIYDARVGGGFPPPPDPVPPCEGEACQSPVSAPNDPTPASASFKGPGDPASRSRARHCPRGKRAVRRKGKARCAKKRASHRKKRHRNHRRRAGR